jgi:hypothetical protein
MLNYYISNKKYCIVDMSGYSQWSPAITYILDNIVFFDGLIYICIQNANTNHQPNSSPTWWATNGGGSTITSISAGAGISVSGSTAILITNTGVRTLTSGGTGITIGGTATDPTVSNTGVLSLTAGTNVSLTGTAQNPIINSAVDGVQTLTAGANIAITGTSANPIIAASYPSSAPILRDLAGAHLYTLTASQVSNSFLYSSVVYTTAGGAITINLPGYADMLATYGGQNRVSFFLGDLDVGLGQTVDLYIDSLDDKTKIYITNTLQGNLGNVNLQNLLPTLLSNVGTYAVPILSVFEITAYINSVKGNVNYNFIWSGNYT